jgi:hypothetical protein
MTPFFARRPKHPAPSVGGTILLGLGMVGLGVGTEVLRRRFMRSRMARRGSALAHRVGSELNSLVTPKRGRGRPPKGTPSTRRTSGGRRKRPLGE